MIVAGRPVGLVGRAGGSRPREAVLVISPHAGRSRKLERARRALDEDTIVVAEELEVEHLDRLPELMRTREGKRRLVIAA